MDKFRLSKNVAQQILRAGVKKLNNLEDKNYVINIIDNIDNIDWDKMCVLEIVGQESGKK
jgi:hypothetical protein